MILTNDPSGKYQILSAVKRFQSAEEKSSPYVSCFGLLVE